MRFGHPEYFHLLWGVLPLIYLYAWAARKKRALLARFCSEEILPRLTSPRIRENHRTRAVLMILSLAFLSLALTQPRWGYKWEDLHREGVDIVLALDVSNSMLASDIRPNRLTRAKHKVADLLKMLEGDRIGLVAFAGTSFLQCPLTLDYAAAEIFLNAIDTGLIPVQGTAIGQAIRTAIKAFDPKDKQSKAIILITDGEDQGGGALEAAKQAAKEGIKIYTIGIGKDLGAPIPDPEAGGFKKDRQGEVVLSKLDETTLKKIALATGGAYVRSVTGDLDLNRIYLEDIRKKIERKDLKTTRRKLWQERFQWLVLLALICLAYDFARREN